MYKFSTPIVLPLIVYFSLSFKEKQKKQLKRKEIEEVKNLDLWQPAELLSPVLQLPGTHGS